MATPANEIAQRMLDMVPFSAHWAPIYLEPLPNCGERITAALAVRGDDATYKVVSVLPPKKVRCMYGDKAQNILGFADLIVDSLRAHLDAQAPLKSWCPPFKGAFMGYINPARGQDIDDVIQTSCMLASSLAEQEYHLESETVANTIQNGDDWFTQIRERTAQRHRDYSARFGSRVSLRPGAPTTKIGYMGERLAAQFGRLIPGKPLTNSRNIAKAYITDLQILRDRENVESTIKRPYYELMLWLPESDSPAWSSGQRDEARAAFQELEDFGDAHELRVEAMHDSNTAVKRILEAEQSA